MKADPLAALAALFLLYKLPAHAEVTATGTAPPITYQWYVLVQGAGETPVTVTDPDAPDQIQRFYRLR